VIGISEQCLVAEVDRGTVALSSDPLVDDLASRTIAHSAWSSMAYEKSLYQLPVAGD
jgi:hypothetical protein